MLTKNITYHTDQTMAPNIHNAHLPNEPAFPGGFTTNMSDIYNTVTDNISYTTPDSYDNYPDYDPSEIYQSPIGIIRLSLCALGLFLNLFSMLAVCHIPSGKNNHIKLIMSLAVSDTLFIISVLLHYLQQLLHISICQAFWVRQFLNIFINATLINLLAMAVDHYLAIMKPLRYPQLMSSFRSNIMIFMIWFVSLFVGFLDPLVAVIRNPSESNLCRNASGDDFDTELIILGFVMIVFLVMMVIYLKIYLTVRKLVRQQRTLTQDEANSYKAIVTTFLILGTFVLCWLPYCTYQIAMITLVHLNLGFLNTHFNALVFINDFLFLLFLFNSLCDPIIYAVRLGQVQSGYRRMLFRCFPRYRYSLNEQCFRSLHQSSNGPRRCTNATLIVDADSGDKMYYRNHTDCENKFYMTSISKDSSLEKNPHVTENNVVSDKEINHNTGNNSVHTDSEPISEQTVIYTDSEPISEQTVIYTNSETGSEQTGKKEITDIEVDKQETKEDTVNIISMNSARSSATDITPLSPVSEKEFWSDNEQSSLINKAGCLNLASED